MGLRTTLIFCFISLTAGTAINNSVCDSPAADILFILDATSKNTSKFFHEMNHYMEHFIDHVRENVDENRTRFAAISFSTQSEVCFNFTIPHSKNANPRPNLDHIELSSCNGTFPVIESQSSAAKDVMKSRSGAAKDVMKSQSSAAKDVMKSQRNTAEALKKTQSLIQTSDRPGVTTFVILATDGYPQDYIETQNEAKTLKSMRDVVMIVITTMEMSSASKLISLASTPLHFIYTDENDFTSYLDNHLIDLLCSRHFLRIKRSTCSDRSYTADGGRTCVVVTDTKNGFHLSEGPTNNCYPQGSTTVKIRWNGTNVLYCTIIITVTVHYCTPLHDTFSNGRRSCTGDAANAYGSTCNYACNSGYSLSGQSSMTCNLASGSPRWSNDAPSCQVQYCQVLPTFPYGSRQCTRSDSNVFQSICTHTCSSGYTLQGPSLIECVAQGSTVHWNNPQTPFCQSQRCEALPSFPYGSRQCTKTDTNAFQSVCTHTCNSSYTLQGSSRIECVAQSSTVQWSSTFPICTKKEEMAEGNSQTGTIVGAVLGTVFAIGGIILIIVFIWYRRSKSRRHNGGSCQANVDGIRDNSQQVFAMDIHAMGFNNNICEKNH